MRHVEDDLSCSSGLGAACHGLMRHQWQELRLMVVVRMFGEARNVDLSHSCATSTLGYRKYATHQLIR